LPRCWPRVPCWVGGHGVLAGLATNVPRDVRDRGRHAGLGIRSGQDSGAVGLGMFGGFGVMALTNLESFVDPLREHRAISGCCGALKPFTGTPQWKFWRDTQRAGRIGRRADLPERLCRAADRRTTGARDDAGRCDGLCHCGRGQLHSGCHCRLAAYKIALFCCDLSFAVTGAIIAGMIWETIA